MSTKEGRLKIIQDKWINGPDHPDNWKNEHGLGSGKLFTIEDLMHCNLHVTCEPCIMCAAAFASVKICRVFLCVRTICLGDVDRC